LPSGERLLGLTIGSRGRMYGKSSPRYRAVEYEGKPWWESRMIDKKGGQDGNRVNASYARQCSYAHRPPRRLSKIAGVEGEVVDERRRVRREEGEELLKACGPR